MPTQKSSEVVNPLPHGTETIHLLLSLMSLVIQQHRVPLFHALYHKFMLCFRFLADATFLPLRPLLLAVSRCTGIITATTETAGMVTMR